MRSEDPVATLDLSPDEVLRTTRSVRRRLDLDRPVERALVEECIAIAQQAPSRSLLQLAHFVVVTDPDKRAALAEVWRKGYAAYKPSPFSVYSLRFDEPQWEAARARIIESLEYLVEHIHQVPVHVVPCVAFRLPADATVFLASTIWGCIHPAAWSFMLAARSRGLGTVWTTFHLMHEQEAAEILGIPVAEVTQAGLIPLAYAKGTDFKPGYRLPAASITHWDAW
jgi:nitroreductase